MTGRIPLPAQPTGVAWPTLTWATAALGDERAGDDLDLAVEAAFRGPRAAELGATAAIVVVRAGRIVAEHYGPGSTARTKHLSWSMAKSITHAALGICIGDGSIDRDAVPVAPEWTSPDDSRAAITLTDLLAMRSGLRFNEDYVDADTSHCIDMLFGVGADDVAAFAASLPLDHPIGEVFNYSSGTTNILARRIGDALGGRDGMERFLRDRLFDPIGMSSAEPRFDAAGTFVGSSYVYATARDFARFGLLYLRDGVWDGSRVLPAGWVDEARTLRSVDEDAMGYGLHWWIHDDETGAFAARGYEGQRIIVVPALDAVIVRLGKTPAEKRPALDRYLDELVGLVACAIEPHPEESPT